MATAWESVVTFMVKEYGPEKMADLMQALTRTLDIDAALMQVYGLDQHGIDSAWRQEIGLELLPKPEGPVQSRRTLLENIPDATVAPPRAGAGFLFADYHLAAPSGAGVGGSRGARTGGAHPTAGRQFDWTGRDANQSAGSGGGGSAGATAGDVVAGRRAGDGRRSGGFAGRLRASVGAGRLHG